jgi:DNA-directed RNA polymerase subunit RPC12/RpoP
MQFTLFGKKFKCATCGKKFKTDSELEQHRQKEHAK